MVWIRALIVVSITATTPLRRVGYTRESAILRSFGRRVRRRSVLRGWWPRRMYPCCYWWLSLGVDIEPSYIMSEIIGAGEIDNYQAR